LCVSTDIEDPLKEERLRRQKELAEDEAELAAMDTGAEGEGAGGEDAGKRRKMAEFNLWKSQRRQSDPNKVRHLDIMLVMKLRYTEQQLLCNYV
jgi:hypothetical protein